MIFKSKTKQSNINLDVLKASRHLISIKYFQIGSSDTSVILLNLTFLNRQIKISIAWSKKGVWIKLKILFLEDLKSV